MRRIEWIKVCRRWAAWLALKERARASAARGLSLTHKALPGSKPPQVAPPCVSSLPPPCPHSDFATVDRSWHQYPARCMCADGGSINNAKCKDLVA